MIKNATRLKAVELLSTLKAARDAMDREPELAVPSARLCEVIDFVEDWVAERVLNGHSEPLL